VVEHGKKCVKPVSVMILVWHLAIVSRPPGVSHETVGSGVSCAWRWSWFCQAIAINQWVQRRLAPGGTCTRPGGLEVLCAWHLVCCVRRCREANELC